MITTHLSIIQHRVKTHKRKNGISLKHMKLKIGGLKQIKSCSRQWELLVGSQVD